MNEVNNLNNLTEDMKMTYRQKLYWDEIDNEEIDASYTMKHLTPSECYNAEDGTNWNDEVM